jgi:hypothetical protein
LREVVATNFAVVSLNDLFAVGLGFDFAGAFILASGLLGASKGFAYRLTQSRNTLSWANVRAAEDRADGIAGTMLLVIGFTVQAVTYILIIGQGSARQTGGAWAYIVSAACVLITAGAAILWARRTRWRRIRRFLVELAHYDLGGTRHESPDISELITYGRILERGPFPDEDSSAYGRRVWEVA